MVTRTAETRIVISQKAKPLHPVTKGIAENLAKINAIRMVKVTPGFLCASSEVCGARQIPVTNPEHPTAIGISLIIEEGHGEVLFYEITSAVKGYGSRMVEAVLHALPKKWKAIVVMDWSDGFWKVMRRRHSSH